MTRWVSLCVVLGCGGTGTTKEVDPADGKAAATPPAGDVAGSPAAEFFARPGAQTRDQVDWTRVAQLSALRAVAEINAVDSGMAGHDPAALMAESLQALASLDYAAEAERASQAWAQWKGAEDCTAAKGEGPQLPSANVPAPLAQAAADLAAGQTWTVTCGKLEGDVVLSAEGEVIGMTVPQDPAAVAAQIEAAENRFVGYMNQPDE